MINDVVVLIPHFNDTNGLKKSLKSINKDENVDILIVDDGSVNDRIIEKEILPFFSAKGEVIFLYNERNLGIEHALNFGLIYILKSNYSFIARLDTGDECLEKRFKLQYDFLIKNKNIKLVGSNVIVTDVYGEQLYRINLPIDSRSIKNKMFISSTVIHPTIMFSKDVLNKVGLYPTNYKAAEDYAFYFEILKYFDFSNIDRFLLKKELNPNSISIKKRNTQALNRVKIILKNFYFGYYPIIGLVRNYILFIVPNKILIEIKKRIDK